MAPTATELAYRIAVRALRVLSPVAAKGDSKLALGVRGRRGAADRLVAWGRANRDPGRPLVWFHAPSVGEGLQARAVLEALRAERPDLQAAYTHFSPSARALARDMPADVADYLPWDVAGEVAPVLDALRPDLLVFTKTEVWPVLAAAAADRSVPVTLVGATLPPGSSRLRWPTRAVLGPVLARLDGIMTIAAEDAERFLELGARAGAVDVTGDPGIDSAARRAAAADPDAPWLRAFRGGDRPVLVAGSTWPADEEVLVPACTAARRRHPELRLVVAPHEPGPSHLEPLEARLRADGWSVARLAEVEERGGVEGADAVVVDRVGVLAALYTVGALAYVGGGFHDQGLHSVLEPAAAGIPVVFGPRHGNARAAGDLLEVGGAREVADAAELEEVVAGWLDDPGSRGHSGEAASGYIEDHRGAAARTADLLSDLVRERSG